MLEAEVEDGQMSASSTERKASQTTGMTKKRIQCNNRNTREDLVVDTQLLQVLVP